MQNIATSMKSAVRRGLRGIARPVWRRIWARIETRLAVEDAKRQQVTREMSNLIAAWHQHMPTFLNATASLGAIAREQARMKRVIQQLGNGNTAPAATDTAVRNELKQLWDATTRVNQEHGQLWKRIEFVRSELLYEMRYGAGQAARDRKEEAAPARIVDVAKVEAARATSIRLNLGCGHIPLDGYVNVDMRELPGVDIVTRIDALPFEQGKVGEIFSSHVLEHFTNEEFERKLLPYWVGLLKCGGIFRAVVPDGAAMISAAAGGNYSFEDFRKVLFGGQDYDGDFHFNMFTAQTLADALRRAGLTDVTVVSQGRKNDIAFELEIVGHKPIA